MKNFKYMGLCMAILSVLSFGFVSCNDDDDDDVKAPVITLEEVGHGDGHVGHPGHDLHLEAAITAEGYIKSISVQIAQKEGNFLITKDYTEGAYVDVRNTEFHEHIDIPEDAPLGAYKLTFVVTAKEGPSGLAECDLTLIEDDGEDDDDEDEHEHHH